MTHDGGLDQGGSNRGGEKQTEDMFFKVETMGLTDRVYEEPL